MTDDTTCQLGERAARETPPETYKGREPRPAAGASRDQDGTASEDERRARDVLAHNDELLEGEAEASEESEREHGAGRTVTPDNTSGAARGDYSND
jgi:hypothetical protein